MKKKKQKIVYHEPKMKYNVGLHKFEPDLTAMTKEIKQAKKQIITARLILSVVIIMAGIVIVLYIMSQVR